MIVIIGIIYSFFLLIFPLFSLEIHNYRLRWIDLIEIQGSGY